MTRTVTLAAVVGVACGLVGGVAGGWLVARDPGRGRGAAGTVRGDLDRVEAEALGARAAVAEAVTRLDRRIDELSGATRAGGPASEALAADLRALRDATLRDLRAADLRLGEIERRCDDLAALAAMAQPESGRPGTAGDDEAVWVTFARDGDPLRRFSALVRLGRARTDRSVRTSTEALRDSHELVVWQALRNLAAFDERAAARDVAALLRHDAAMVRAASWDALRRFGAPDAGFDPVAAPADRRAATEAVERWAQSLADE